jgi:hypothetical protein
MCHPDFKNRDRILRGKMGSLHLELKFLKNSALELILWPISGYFVKNWFGMKSIVSGTEMGIKVGLSGPQKKPEKGGLLGGTYL